MATVAACSLIGLVPGCSSTDAPQTTRSEPSSVSAGPTTSAIEPTTTATTAPPPTTAPPELPGGGRSILPEHRVVAFYGNAETATLGVLGETGPEEAVARLAAAAAPFETPDRPVIGAFELIVSVAQGSPGDDGDFTAPTPPDLIQQWISVAQANGLLVILDVQPGRSPFPEEVKRYEQYLRQPGVSLALDPEWRMGPDERPGQTIGSVETFEILAVAKWLSAIVTENDLPQKLFVIHQFTPDMVKNRQILEPFPGLATVVHIDGFGTRPAKTSKYEQLHADPPFYNGFKLFYDEDTDMFDPAGALALTPSPDLITYQ